ncbi:MAG: hypothetical protein N3A38_05705 [Planctomycetota bacterium]|nr:hypothetical protein [Planctomycetota bacterium]
MASWDADRREATAAVSKPVRAAARPPNTGGREGSAGLRGGGGFLAVAAIAAPVAVLCHRYPCSASDLDEFRIKREQVFEFAQKPQVSRRGDRVTISFEAKAACDATVAIETADGKIVRHLACGVLGPNAPAPFRKGSLAQTLVWDGKNDQGEYIDDKEGLVVRVSLGLNAKFERNLFWEPKRRHGREAPLFQATAEGVYVYDGGNARDFVELYDHEGNYVRTVYPFPADKIEKVLGISRAAYPQDGLTLPVKPTFLQQTFLTCGNLYGYEYPKEYAVSAEQADGDCHYGMYGNASSILAVGGGRIALGKTYLFRFATDGSSGGMRAEGPAIALITKGAGWETRGKTIAVAPRSAALSPDGKTLYLTGYNFCNYGRASADIVTSGDWRAFHCVMRMAMDGDEPPKVFVGSAELEKWGSDDKSLKVPTSVAVDRQGRVYVADYMNDRVQVFSSEGIRLKTIQVQKPSIVCIAPKSQDICVFSSLVHNGFFAKSPEDSKNLKTQLTVFGPFDDPRRKAEYPLPEGYGGGLVGYLYSGLGFPLSATVDDYTTPPTVWLANEWTRENVMTRGKISYTNIELYSVEEGQLKRKRSFGEEVAKSVRRAQPERYGRMRLYANPANGKVYVGEGEAFDWKSFKSLIELDPGTGKIAIVPLPFDAEDMCFDHRGHAYLRTICVVARYEFGTWREVPWDYGERRKGVHTSASSDRKETDLVSGLILPADGGWHHGGLCVSLDGNLAVACGLNVEPQKTRYETGSAQTGGLPYSPKMYPGRSVEGRGGAPLIHVWDRHGKILFSDVIPGIGGNTYGMWLDRDNAVYAMLSATRVLDGKTYQNRLSGTLIKVLPGKAKILCRKATIPLGEADAPKRPVDLVGCGLEGAWVEGAEWMYGGVGYDGKNAGVGCGCWNARAAFDYFDRTFAPELHRFRVAVLDSAGNLIMRIGRYGNADSAGPGSAVPLGGDEVGMMHGAYLAVHTDRRLYVADSSNDRVFSVRLDYHATERVALRDIPDGEKRAGGATAP